jgi:pilus assembly protein CpaE
LSDITMEKAQETIGKPIFWQVPNDFKAMLGARNAGVPLLTHAPKSRVHQSIMGMANTLCGKVPAEPAKKERRSFFSFR